jgi:hypothetical protein
MEINKALQRQADVERLLHEQLEVLYRFNAKLYYCLSLHVMASCSMQNKGKKCKINYSGLLGL